jgi:hypothetical protein
MAVVAALVAGMVVLLISLHNGIRQESCLAAGHRNCVPIEER